MIDKNCLLILLQVLVLECLVRVMPEMDQGDRVSLMPLTSGLSTKSKEMTKRYRDWIRHLHASALACPVRQKNILHTRVHALLFFCLH